MIFTGTFEASAMDVTSLFDSKETLLDVVVSAWDVLIAEDWRDDDNDEEAIGACCFDEDEGDGGATGAGCFGEGDGEGAIWAGCFGGDDED